MHRTAAWTMFTAALLFALSGNAGRPHAEDTPAKYSETIAVMQMLYGIELRAVHRFHLFSERATEEGYGHTAHLFKAIAHSERIHADHFKALLEELGVQPTAIDFSSIKAERTETNLEYALKSELAEITRQYPRYINRIKPERHTRALEYLRFAWQAEKHHRMLLREHHSLLFDRLISSVGATESRYYVNSYCGTTVSELPLDECPVCRMPVESYIEIPRPD